MPVWCRHYCFSRPKAVGKCTASNLLLLEIRGNINISRADELGEFLQLDELVKEDDVSLDFRFKRQASRDSNDTLRHDRERDWDAWGVQHEFGIFGGLEGSHVLALLRAERETHAIEAEFERVVAARDF